MGIFQSNPKPKAPAFYNYGLRGPCDTCQTPDVCGQKALCQTNSDAMASHLIQRVREEAAKAPPNLKEVCAACTHAVACAAIGQCSIAAEQKKVAHAMLIHTQDHPPEPAVAPPSWEVYAHVEVDGTLKARPPRILHKGVELEGVTKVGIESGLRSATVITLTIEVPPDGYILIKGAQHDWRSTRGRDSKK